MVEKMVLLLLAFVVSSASATSSFENELLEQSESEQLLISPRIIGGVPVDINDFKFYARLVQTDFSSYYSHLCGGTLINKQYVLTAAHCLEMTGIAKEELAIVVNNTSFAGVNGNELKPVESIYIHPEYNPDGYVNDIAIIKLSSKITDDVEFISLPSDDDKLYYEQLATMSVTGFGYTDTSGTSPDSLLTTEVTLLSDSDCESRVSYYFRQDFIHDNALCVIPTNSNGSCSGDSGGPLTYVDFDGKNKQVGLVSYGAKECVLLDVPTVYTELNGYNEWIEANSQITADELPGIDIINNEIISSNETTFSNETTSSNGGAASYYFLSILFGGMIMRRKLLKK